MTIPRFFVFSPSVAEKTGRCREIFCGSWVRTVVAVAVIERFKQELTYGLSAGKKSGRLKASRYEPVNEIDKIIEKHFKI